ncbi:MAG: polyhydroxyalkanoic acid synthase [Burkholderiales bacterium PBB4]|nr:MAG: polyhydroxyalkanoic acid synthase [Burkholderiales bacterium PBB4]
MADLHILRAHALGLPAARKIAYAWAEQVESEFDMACTYAEGKAEDEVVFKRSGVSGTLQVTADHFELNAKLGFLLGAFKGRIEAEIVKNLDDLLAPKPSAAAKAAKPAAKKVASKK